MRLSELMHLLLTMKLIGESIKDKPNGCLVDELGAMDCRVGCSICSFNEKLGIILEYFPSKEEGPGKRCIFYFSLRIMERVSIESFRSKRTGCKAGDGLA